MVVCWSWGRLPAPPGLAEEAHAPPWSPAGTMATSPAPRRRSCSPGPARTAASSCAPASPSPGPTRSVCCEYNARPASLPLPGLVPVPPGTEMWRCCSERGNQLGAQPGPGTESGSLGHGLQWSCVHTAQVCRGHRGLRCTAVPGVQAWQRWTPPEPPQGLVTHCSCPGGWAGGQAAPRGSRDRRRGAGSVRLAEAQGSMGVGVSELGQLRGCPQMPGVETSWRTDVARRPSQAQAPGPWRKPLSGEPRVWGGFTPERTFSSPRSGIWGPAHRGSHRHSSYGLFPPCLGAWGLSAA